MREEDPKTCRIGIDLGGTKIELIVMQRDGQIVHKERCDTPSGDYQKTLEALTALIQSAAVANQLPPETPVGIGTPGAVSLKTGLMMNCNSTCLNDQPLSDDLSAMTGRQVKIANDADCFALSEASDGAGKDFDIVFGVILGTGVGGGIVTNKRLNRGVNAISGEWGHNKLAASNMQHERACYCGRIDCVEAWLSGPGFSKGYEEATGQAKTGFEVAQLLNSGDPTAEQVMQAYTQRLAEALSTVINILDPGAIVLGGGMSNVQAIYDQVPEKLIPHVFSDMINTKIIKAVHGDSSGVRGAAWLWSVEEVIQLTK